MNTTTTTSNDTTTEPQQFFYHDSRKRPRWNTLETSESTPAYQLEYRPGRRRHHWFRRTVAVA